MEEELKFAVAGGAIEKRVLRPAERERIPILDVAAHRGYHADLLRVHEAVDLLLGVVAPTLEGIQHVDEGGVIVVRLL